MTPVNGREELREAADGLALAKKEVALIALFGLTRLLQRLLYGVSPFDPLTFAGMTLAVRIAAATAAVVPARRAVSVDAILARGRNTAARLVFLNRSC